MNTKTSDPVTAGYQDRPTKLTDGVCDSPRAQKDQHPQPHKKKVRRRLHNTRPYQERLLNMAEARREIATALKFHRAAMKQASEQKEKQVQEQRQTASMLPQQKQNFDKEERMRSRRNPRIYPSSSTNLADYMEKSSPGWFTAPPDPFAWPASQIPYSPFSDPLNLPLPNQPLGLSLNLQDFGDIEATVFSYSSLYSSSSSSSPSSQSAISFASEEAPRVAISPNLGSTVAVGQDQIVKEEGVGERKSIGEQSQVQWDDTMNLRTSAWWLKVSKAMELDTELKGEEYDGFYPFEEVMEFPSWLNPNESFLETYPVDGPGQECLQDPALPCMDIGEIEGMDEDWLA